MAAGLGFKTFTTGEVLTAADTNGYLMQGVLVFASSAARAAAITSPQEGQYSFLKDTNSTEYYDGAAWVSASGSSGSSNVAGKNGVLNSAMNVWQRGTSISLAASTAYTSGFTADRWQTSTAANQATTVARQPTGDTTNLPDIQYAMRFQRNSGQTGTTGYSITQSFETINSVPFAGKTVTMSFYARAGATAISSGATTLTQYLYTGTGTDQNIFAGFTGSATPINSAKTLTATWQRFTTSATLASTTTQIAPVFVWTPIGTAGATDYIEITGVQVEIAASASAYSPNTSTYQTELAACQRYYVDLGNCTFHAYSVTGVIGPRFPVTMRTTPTITLAYGGVTDRMYNLDNGTTKDLVSNYVIATTQQVSNWYTSNPASWATAKGEGWATTVKASAEL